jgi:hypothetical protein
MKKLIPKITDIICFLGGSTLLIYNLLDFRGGYDSFNFYYKESTQILASIGLGLIVLGFLIRTWRKEKT